MASAAAMKLSPLSSSSIHFLNPATLSSSHPILSLRSTPLPNPSISISTSPFTEKHSDDRYRRDNWLYSHTPSPQDATFSRDSDSIRENDIASQLPELKRILAMLKSKRDAAASVSGGQRQVGDVSLVGTGPGDPDLLTLKAVKVIQSADLLLYDRLVSNQILELVNPNSRLLYVGKTAGYHSRTQEEIHELLLSFAEVGANVVRLKGGDPLVFGRGGEEMDFLRQQGIQVKVIPGIFIFIVSIEFHF